MNGHPIRIFDASAADAADGPDRFGEAWLGQGSAGPSVTRTPVEQARALLEPPLATDQQLATHSSVPLATSNQQLATTSLIEHLQHICRRTQDVLAATDRLATLTGCGAKLLDLDAGCESVVVAEQALLAVCVMAVPTFKALIDAAHADHPAEVTS